MKFLLQRLPLLALLLFFGAAAHAHEFWVLPQQFTLPAAPAAIPLQLAVGENFAGEPVAFSRALVARLRRHSAAGATDLGETVAPGEPRPSLPLQLGRPGTHLVELTTHPSEITLSADKFHAYLHEEGLDHVIRSREAAGEANAPGRERYRRTIKTLVQVGPGLDDSFARRTGQKLELVPASHPARHAAGRDLGFQLLFDGRPLANALVKFWHRRGSQTLVVRTVTDAQGKVVVTPPWPGTWMASAVHMVRATDSPAHDWDSYWANFTFALPAAAR